MNLISKETGHGLFPVSEQYCHVEVKLLPFFCRPESKYVI